MICHPVISCCHYNNISLSLNRSYIVVYEFNKYFATCPWLFLLYPWLSLLYPLLSLHCPRLSLLYPCLLLLSPWLSLVSLAIPGLSVAALCSLILTMAEVGAKLQLLGIKGGLVLININAMILQTYRYGWK